MRQATLADPPERGVLFTSVVTFLSAGFRRWLAPPDPATATVAVTVTMTVAVTATAHVNR